MDTLPRDILGELAGHMSLHDAARFRQANREMAEVIPGGDIRLALKKEADEWTKFISVAGKFFGLDHRYFIPHRNDLNDIADKYGFLDDAPRPRPHLFDDIIELGVADQRDDPAYRPYRYVNDPEDEFVYDAHSERLVEMGNMVLPYGKVTLVCGYYQSMNSDTEG